MSLSRTVFYLCLSFLLGLSIESFFDVPQFLWLGFLIIPLFLIFILWKYKKTFLLGLCLLFAVLGIWRCQSLELKIVEEPLISQNGGEFIFKGIVVKEPDVREKNIRLVLGDIESFGNHFNGKILVVAGRYLKIDYGDRVLVKGFLETPEGSEDFNYKEYLLKDGVYSIMRYPQIELLEEGKGNPLFSFVFRIKSALMDVILENFSPPHSSILGAIILGDKGAISEEWKLKLNYSGLRHLTAVSGMHVAILTSILMGLFLALGLHYDRSFYLTSFLILLFIILTGLQASAIRAGIMGEFFLLARFLGRENSSLRGLVFAAVVMLFFNPLLLRLDVGFQLSFLAMAGIIYLMPLFKIWLKSLPNFLSLRDGLAMTLSAQVFTLPILTYNFGYFSLVSPLTNILAVPIVPLLMGLGFAFVAIGSLLSPLGWLLSLPLWILDHYLLKIADFFSGFSFSAYSFELSPFYLIFSYIILIAFVFLLKRKTKNI